MNATPVPEVVAHVAEDHGHHVDGSPQVVGDLVELAVIAGALPEPAPEDRLDGQVELLVRIGREGSAAPVLDDRLELADHVAEVLGTEVRVTVRSGPALRLVERVVEALARHVHDDPAEHLDEPSVRVPAEALVAGQGDQPGQGLLVESEIQDGVHHAGHRELGARADTDEQGVGRVAEALAGLGLDLLDGVEDVRPEPLREPLAGREVVVAGLGRDREARRCRAGRRGSSRAAPRPCRRGDPSSSRCPRPARRPRRRCSAWRPCARARRG